MRILPQGEVKARLYKAGELALDVEEADFLEVEQLAIEFEPLVHVALENVVGQVVEVPEADALGLAVGQPVELGVIGRGFKVLVDEVDQAAANADDGGHIHSLARAGVFLGTLCERMGQRLFGIDHAPGHGRGARPMFLDEPRGMGAGFGVQIT